MDKIKLGLLGLGNRGRGLLGDVLKNFPDVDVVAVGDEYEDRVQIGIERVEEARDMRPKGYTNHSDLIADPEVNVIVIATSWESHIQIAIECMRAGKISAVEVGGAYSVDDCWRLVRTWEETKTPFMFLENCCFDKRELLATKMVRKGEFGEVVYCHGAYCHNLRDQICGGIRDRHYRFRNYLRRNGDTYPTHNLGPIAKVLNINRGNRLLKLVSMASKARGLHEFVKDKEEFAFLRDTVFAHGDIITTMISCADGSTITLKLDTTLPRFYSREFTVCGTKGMYSERDNLLITDENLYDYEYGVRPVKDCADNYQDQLPKVWKEMLEKKITGGHGGMDTLMLRAYFDAALKGEEMPIDVYDAATWMVITCLSEASIANGSQSIDIPDFTNGRWVMREPKDVICLD